MKAPVKGFIDLDLNDPFSGPGIYVLILRFDEDTVLEVGSLGDILLKKGNYAYVGSAKAGLWGRVKRHLSDPEKKRWHIDMITGSSAKRKVFWKKYSEGDECRTAEDLRSNYDSIPGFGCSDCKCVSHLFHIRS